MTLNTAEVHVVVEGERGGPVEVFEQLDGQVDRDGMLDAALGVSLKVGEPF